MMAILFPRDWLSSSFGRAFFVMIDTYISSIKKRKIHAMDMAFL